MFVQERGGKHNTGVLPSTTGGKVVKLDCERILLKSLELVK
jgi:hypothetical protein